MIKRLVTIVLLLSFMGLASFMDVRAVSAYVLPICWVGIIGLLAFAVYHIKHANKSTLLGLLFLGLVCLPSISWADASSITKDLTAMQNAQTTVCGTSTELDGSFDEDILNTAYDVVDRSYRIKASGTGLSSAAQSALSCAQKYIQKAGDLASTMSPACNPLQMALRQSLEGDSACWPCNVVKLIIDTIQKVAVNAYDPMKEIATGLLGLILLFWIAIRVMLFFGQMGFARIGEFFTQLLQQMLIVLFLSAVLYGPIVEFYRMTVSPFIMASASIAQEVTKLSDSVSGFKKTPVGKVLHILDKVNLAGGIDCNYCQKTSKTNTNAIGETFLDEGAVNAALCMVCTVYKQVSPFIELGKALNCVGGQLPLLSNLSAGDAATGMFSKAGANWQILGLLFIGAFSLFMFLIAFYLISVFLELALVLIFTPIFVACLAFKVTRPYAKKAWELILHSMVVLIAVALAINLAMVLFVYMLPDSISGMVISMFMSDPSGLLDAFSLTGHPTSKIAATPDGIMGMLSSIPGIGSLVSGGATNMFTLLLLVAFITIAFGLVKAIVQVAEAVTGTQGISAPDDIAGNLLMGAAAGFGLVKAGGKVLSAGAGKIKEKISGKS